MNTFIYYTLVKACRCFAVVASQSTLARWIEMFEIKDLCYA